MASWWVYCFRFRAFNQISFLSFLDNLTITSGDDSKYVLKEHDGVQNAILTLENASLEDKGEYKCVGKNKATGINKIAEASDVTNVRVKGEFFIISSSFF